MLKRVFAILLVIVFALSVAPGCSTLRAWMCPNGPEVAKNLSTTVDQLKTLVDKLKASLLAGYDAEIELAYLAAKGSLAAAQALMAQACPEPAKVAAVVDAAEKVAIPQARSAVKKAVHLGFIKP